MVAAGILHMASVLPKLPNACDMTYSRPCYLNVPVESRPAWKYFPRYVDGQIVDGVLRPPRRHAGALHSRKFGRFKQVRCSARANALRLFDNDATFGTTSPWTSAKR